MLCESGAIIHDQRSERKRGELDLMLKALGAGLARSRRQASFTRGSGFR